MRPVDPRNLPFALPLGVQWILREWPSLGHSRSEGVPPLLHGCNPRVGHVGDTPVPQPPSAAPQTSVRQHSVGGTGRPLLDPSPLHRPDGSWGPPGRSQPTAGGRATNAHRVHGVLHTNPHACVHTPISICWPPWLGFRLVRQGQVQGSGAHPLIRGPLPSSILASPSGGGRPAQFAGPRGCRFEAARWRGCAWAPRCAAGVEAAAVVMGHASCPGVLCAGSVQSLGGGGGLCLKGRGAIGAVPERLQSGHRGCESGWGRRLLAVGNAVGAGVGVWECLWGRISAVGRGEGGSPPPNLLKRFPGVGAPGSVPVCEPPPPPRRRVRRGSHRRAHSWIGGPQKTCPAMTLGSWQSAQRGDHFESWMAHVAGGAGAMSARQPKKPRGTGRDAPIWPCLTLRVCPTSSRRPGPHEASRPIPGPLGRPPLPAPAPPVTCTPSAGGWNARNAKGPDRQSRQRRF